MLRGFFLLLPLTFTLLAACSSDGGDAADLETCDEVGAELSKELASIASCTADSECGQELKGTSCGCTNNAVARVGADATRFNELLGRKAELECNTGGGTCDCPGANGFLCKDGACTWNYTGL